jgi:hypothetical protein
MIELELKTVFKNSLLFIKRWNFSGAALRISDSVSKWEDIDLFKELQVCS